MVFPNEDVAIISGLMVGSTIGGLLLAIIGYVVNLETKKIVAKLADEDRAQGILNAPPAGAKGVLNAPPIPGKGADRRNHTSGDGGADILDATANSVADEGYDGPAVKGMRLRSQSQYWRSQIGQQFVNEIERGLEKGTFDLDDILDSEDDDDDEEMEVREPEVGNFSIGKIEKSSLPNVPAPQSGGGGAPPAASAAKESEGAAAEEHENAEDYL